MVNKFGNNFIYWWIEPKNDLNSDIFLAFGRLFIESDCPTSGFTPEFDILNPSHSSFFWKNAHFFHFTAMFLLSKMFKIFVSIALCSFKDPFEAIKCL